MGPVISRTWFIYGRDIENNWLETPIYSTISKENDVNYHTGRFKHQCFLMILNIEHTNVNKMYLYRGWRRIKCEKSDNKITVTFSDEEARKAWKQCNRSNLGKTFDKKWHQTCSEGYVYSFVKNSTT